MKHLVDRLLKNRASMPLLILLVAKTSKHGNLLARRTDLTKIEVVDVNSIVVLNYKDLEHGNVKILFLSIGLLGGTSPIKTLLSIAWLWTI